MSRPKRPRLTKCSCCWGPKERPTTPHKLGDPVLPCQKCIEAGCKPAYVGYWTRAKGCPRHQKFVKAAKWGETRGPKAAS